ncbi:MAG: oxygen-insensitive NAD(P)H nitroreductase [Proteobacteria bacterium]|jgi:nitroreductase/dihydropteridine reductase|nr:oxygen-insensitive NAD(P)H nitroreductase [Alphaproteobacteria bacterium]NCC03786.1 oxygen-insensitive NAD(P)H nitroreductase [Pseudomonadota bacterium]
MDIEQIVKSRYTAKAFDPTRKIEPALVDKIESILRYSPSSTNSQPWHFFIVGTEEGKARLQKALTGRYAFNGEKIRDASHAVLLCHRATIDETYLREVLAQEASDGRFADDKAMEGQHQGRSYFVNRHRFELRDAQHWMDKQLYLSLGFLLLGAATLGIDACPIEGFDQVAMDEELGLRAQNLNSSVLVALGYHSDKDFNANLPKSRLPANKLITKL